MKKILFILVTITLSLTACADNDQLVEYAELPVVAQTFIRKYFNPSDVSYIEREREACTSSTTSFSRMPPRSISITKATSSPSTAAAMLCQKVLCLSSSPALFPCTIPTRSLLSMPSAIASSLSRSATDSTSSLTSRDTLFA